MSYSILIILEHILKKRIENHSDFFLPDVITKCYPEITEDSFADAPKMAVNIGDKFQLEIFRPTVADKSELEVFF